MKQAGYTIVELLAAVAALMLITTLAMLSGGSLLSSMRVSKETARLADSFAIARETAMARYEYWMLEFPAAPGGSDVISNYVVKSCSRLASPEPSGCDPADPADWVVVPKGALTAERGVALEIVTPHPAPPAALQVIYDQLGRYTASVDVEIKICALARDPAGVSKCRSGGPARTIRVRKSSGIVQSLS